MAREFDKSIWTTGLKIYPSTLDRLQDLIHANIRKATLLNIEEFGILAQSDDLVTPTSNDLTVEETTRHPSTNNPRIIIKAGLAVIQDSSTIKIIELQSDGDPVEITSIGAKHVYLDYLTTNLEEGTLSVGTGSLEITGIDTKFTEVFRRVGDRFRITGSSNNDGDYVIEVITDDTHITVASLDANGNPVSFTDEDDIHYLCIGAFGAGYPTEDNYELYEYGRYEVTITNGEEAGHDLHLASFPVTIISGELTIGTITDLRIGQLIIFTGQRNADKLDGQEGAFYQNASNLNAGTLLLARLPDGIPESKLGLNYPTHSNANDPTADEKLALQGEQPGTYPPGDGNRFVTKDYMIAVYGVGGEGGDMTTAVYDTDENGIVDKAEGLADGAQVRVVGPNQNDIPLRGAGGKVPDAESVDGFHATASASPNSLIATGGDGKLPSAVIPDISATNADTVDNIHASTNREIGKLYPLQDVDGEAKVPVAAIEMGEGSNLDADTVRGLEAYPYDDPHANALVGLDGNGKLPLSTMPFEKTQVAVITGDIDHLEAVPLPPGGYTQEQCVWFIVDIDAHTANNFTLQAFADLTTRVTTLNGNKNKCQDGGGYGAFAVDAKYVCIGIK